MNELSAKCVILKKGNFREYDVWLKVLSPTCGFMTLFAFGGVKSKRRFCGCLDVLNTLSCRISYSERKNYHVLEEAVLESAPRKLRNNWRRMGIAQNCLAFLNAIEMEPASGEKVFELIADMRATLQNAKLLPGLFALYFRFRLASILGYAPALEACGSCGMPSPADDICFAHEEGKIYCGDCRKHLTSTKKICLPQEGLEILRKIKNSQPAHWPEDDPPLETRRPTAQAMDDFIRFHIGLEYCNGYFRHI